MLQISIFMNMTCIKTPFQHVVFELQYYRVRNINKYPLDQGQPTYNNSSVALTRS